MCVCVSACVCVSSAAIGAWYLGEYAEALGLMVFYTIGEMVEKTAAYRSRGNIKALLDIRPDSARLIKDGSAEIVKPEDVKIGDIIEIHAGEKAPLDGVMLDENAYFNTAALTGESLPRNIKKGGEVLSGMLLTDSTVRIQITKSYENSTLSRILKMVEDASSHKSPTEMFIRKFARVYTPTVYALSASLVVLPAIFLGSDFEFGVWLYRALVLLVISCPCAFVISVPMAYFSGIGLASKNGILFKGANYLEALVDLKTLITDKTGTLTKGEFTIQKISAPDKEKFLEYLNSIEEFSNHPIAKSAEESG